MCQRRPELLRAGGEVRQVEVQGQLDPEALGDPPGGVGVAREVAVDLEGEGVDRQQGQAAVDRLPAAEEVVDDRRQVVGDDDLLGQAPEDQVRPLVELLEVEPARATAICGRSVVGRMIGPATRCGKNETNVANSMKFRVGLMSLR